MILENHKQTTTYAVITETKVFKIGFTDFDHFNLKHEVNRSIWCQKSKYKNYVSLGNEYTGLELPH